MKHLIIGTAGHVDHGKTALIKALTNIDCDTHPEEKQRGITINLGFSHLDLPSGNSLGIIDVPGHKDFIRTMVAGAFGIDIALLVVAADSGIMPQTVEHVRIVELLGVKHGVVALTKSDLVDQEMLELAQLEVEEFLESTTLKGAPVIPVSSVTGEGILQLKEELDRLVEQMAPRKESDRFRMYIDRIFNVKGKGYVVTGSVLEGGLRTGDDLYLLPAQGKKVKVRSIQRHGVEVEAVQSGDRAALNLSGLKKEDYQRGMLLSDRPFEPVTMIDATLNLFSAEMQVPLWTDEMFYSGTFECRARMHLLYPDELGYGQQGLVQLHLDKETVPVAGDRYVIRNTSNTLTLGGGIIIDPKPLHHRRRTEKLIRELQLLALAVTRPDAAEHRIKIELKKTGIPDTTEDLARKLHLDEEDVLEAARKNNSGLLVITPEGEPPVVCSTEIKEKIESEVLDALNEYHRENPILEEGLPAAGLYGKTDCGSRPTGRMVIDHVLTQMERSGRLERWKDTYRLPGHRVTIDNNTREQLQLVEHWMEEAGNEKPNIAAIEAKAHEKRINKARLKMLLRYLVQEGRIFSVEGEYVHKKIADRCCRLLLEKIAVKEDGINEKEFREMAGITKKLAQVLLKLWIQEGLITKPTFYILITQKGRKWIENNKKN
ncbi:MAG: selenocysteine-specific translation elongation factor [Bacteroidales bacterium]